MRSVNITHAKTLLSTVFLQFSSSNSRAYRKLNPFLQPHTDGNRKVFKAYFYIIPSKILGIVDMTLTSLHILATFLSSYLKTGAISAKFKISCEFYCNFFIILSLLKHDVKFGNRSFTV